MASEQLSGQNNSSTGSSVPSNLVFLLAGAAIGAATALLFAPKPGSELRHDIADVTRRGYDGALDLTHRVKDETSHFYERLREKGSDLYHTASDKLSSSADNVAELGSNLENKADDVLSLAEGQKKAAERKSTNVV